MWQVERFCRESYPFLYLNKLLKKLEIVNKLKLNNIEPKRDI